MWREKWYIGGMDTNSTEQPQAEATQRSALHEVQPTEVQRVKHPGGRPTKWNPQLEQDIIHDYQTCGDSVEVIAQRHGITERTIYQWIADIPQFSQAFAQARQVRAYAMVAKTGKKYEELAIMAQTATNEELRRIDLQGRLAHMHGRHSEWLAERMNPKQFASQQHVDVTQRALNVHLHADTPEDVQAMAQRLEELEDTPT